MASLQNFRTTLIVLNLFTLSRSHTYKTTCQKYGGDVVEDRYEQIAVAEECKTHSNLKRRQLFCRDLRNMCNLKLLRGIEFFLYLIVFHQRLKSSFELCQTKVIVNIFYTLNL